MHNALKNPFESTLALARVVDTVAGPSLTDPSDPAAVTIRESSTATGGKQETPADTSTVTVAAGSVGSFVDEENYIPELFSVFARRRCMAIISPPLPQECRRDFEPDMDALFDAIVPPEPPPLFLRKPRAAFMRALFELSN